MGVVRKNSAEGRARTKVSGTPGTVPNENALLRIGHLPLAGILNKLD